MTYVFVPDHEVIATFDGYATISDLSQEQGVYSATPDFVRKHCGPIANRILNLVPDSYYERAQQLGLHPNCDVRVHRLYPGDYPAYPGWHCDGEYRETYFAQPDLDRVPVSDHLTATVSTHRDGVCSPEFLSEHLSCEVDTQRDDVTLWGQVHTALEHRLPERRVFQSRDGQLVRFGARCLHRAMPARIRGWRLFFRMSMWHKPNLGAGGMITRQEQVYRLAEGGGW